MSILTLLEVSHFPTFDEVQWLSLSFESQCLPKYLWNSGTVKVNFHFWAGHKTDAPNLGLSREFWVGWHLWKQFLQCSSCNALYVVECPVILKSSYRI